MPLPALRSLLEATPYPLLTRIARLRGYPVPRNLPKADLVTLLEGAMSDLDALESLLTTLAPAELAVLQDLVWAGGRLPRRHLARQHGDLREFRPWDPASPARPWQYPSSPTERLYFLGLVFYDPASGDLLIPAELLPYYPAPPRPQPAAPAAPTPAPALVALHDLAQLLALIAAAPPRLIHGRWLPPSLLHEWGARCAHPPAHPTAPGELRMPRRRFLHYLADAAALVAPAGPFLVLTPQAWDWLSASPADRLASLWPAFAAPNPRLWANYRLPGHRLKITPTLHGALIDELMRSAAQSQALGSPAALAARLLACNPAPHIALGQNIWDAEGRLTQALIALLTGPLTTLGVVAAAPGAPELCLTDWGLYLLGAAAAPTLDPPPPFDLGADFVFSPPGLFFDPLALVTLAACAERRDSGDYQITSASWARALQRGESTADLLTRLNAIAQRPLHGAEVATLDAWARNARRMRIRRLTILEVDDPAIIARLQRTRRGRQLVLSTVSRRAVAVDEGKLPLLVRRLAAQEGAPPLVDLPPAAPPLSTELGSGGAALLWLAARVYCDLGDVLPLPARLPSDLLQHLAAQLAPDALSAAEASAQRVRTALQDALSGRLAFPALSRPTVDVAESLALIEDALAEGQALEICYYTAGRDEVTHRLVEPYRLERRCTRRGDELYLVAFCHRAQAERVFRLDRICSIVKVPLPDGESSST